MLVLDGVEQGANVLTTHLNKLHSGEGGDNVLSEKRPDLCLGTQATPDHVPFKPIKRYTLKAALFGNLATQCSTDGADYLPGFVARILDLGGVGGTD